MHLILLSGGSGKRLWPLSNDIRSKQFLRFLNNPDGEKESMVQRVYRQLQSIGGWDSLTVVAGISQKDQIELQLGKDVSLLTEPERRNTFPAIAFACANLFHNENIDLDKCVAVLPIDSFVEENFFIMVQEMEKVLNYDELRRPNICLLGATPFFPSEKYGYIVPAAGEMTVKYFKEKPTKAIAEELIKSGALWNCGVFGFKLSYMIDILKEKFSMDDFSDEEVEGFFRSLDIESFDREIVEKESNIAVLHYKDEWKDLGTWETFTEEIQENGVGNVVLDENCLNTHVINERGIPLVVMGMKNTVVVASHDGVLVANKGQTHKLKELTMNLGHRPMYEERRWGSYVVLDKEKRGDIETLTKRIVMMPTGQISYQYHNYRKEVWTICCGQGIVYVEGIKRYVGQGDVIQIEKGMKHAIKALTELEFIEVQLGVNLIEDDIVRLQYDWE